MCIATGGLSGGGQMRFREVCRLLQSVFHFEYHDNLEALKDAYAPLNPDRDTRKVGVFTGAGQTSFVDQLALLLDKAYRTIVMEQSYDKGRDANITSLAMSVHREVEDGEPTGIETPIEPWFFQPPQAE